VESHPLNAWEKQAKKIEKDNARSHPNLRIRGMRWLGRTENKKYAPLVIKVNSAEQANQLISEGVVIAYDLKLVDRYDSKCRITQCFKCQKYGHISLTCRNAERCGHCGGEHATETCTGELQAKRKRCAACNGAEHVSWSMSCPARAKEANRAKGARQILPKLFPVSAKEKFTNTTADIVRFNSDPQASGGWSTVTTKKRKFNTPGRPIGAISRTKTIDRDANSRSITDFTSQIQQATQDADGAHANRVRDAEEIMEI